MYRSISQMEPLESRTLLSAVVTPDGTYTGNLTPTGKVAQKAYVAVSGNKKYATHVPATIDLTVAANGTASGTLTMPQIGTYALGGTVLDVLGASYFNYWRAGCRNFCRPAGKSRQKTHRHAQRYGEWPTRQR